jgi:FkbM family methyltransferase
VYLCSTGSIAGPGEDGIVETWAAAVRAAEDERLRSANLLIRPHPMELHRWTKRLNISEEKAFEFTAAVWPIRPTTPVSERGRADFYDTLYHADAVVGLNTSAMIEATILRKPVLTFMDHPRSRGQVGNLHFKYLADGGSVLLATTLAEHIKQLASALQGDHRPAACDRFVEDFVRPRGRETSASTLLAERIIDMLNGKDKAGVRPPHKSRPTVVATETTASLATFVNSLETEAREEVVALATAPKYLAVDGSALRFYVHSAVEEGRVRKFKEPWTIEWLRKIPPGSVLYDVGANIGVTALVAAEGEGRNVRVVAIEPFPGNFASLVKNILLNDLNQQVVALPFGLCSTTGVMPLHWAGSQVGTSRHSFGAIANPKKPRPLEPVASHHCVGYRFDDLVELPGLPFPTHIKIDVDGSELEVRVLRDRRCWAAQIEVSDPADSSTATCRAAVIEQMTSLGFQLKAEHPHRIPSVRDLQFEKPRDNG